MFKQLKRRMLLINLSILTVLLIGVSLTLYLSTYTNIQQSINQEISFYVDHINDFFRTDGPVIIPGGDDGPNTRSVTFLLKISASGDSYQSYTSYNFTDTTIFDTALSLAKSDSGTIAFDGDYWYYTTTKTFDNATVYIFMNVTNQQTVLNNLILTFIFVFLGSFIVVYLLSTIVTNKSVAKIKEAFIKQKQFVANASHELKTPLAIINTNVDIIASNNQDPESEKWLNYIKIETERMNKLTKDLLYLTKVSEQKAYEIVKERLNLSEITESIILSFEALAYEKNIRIDYDIVPEIFTEFSRDQYDQVVHILLDNAIKYTPKNGQINVKMTINSNNILISFKNNGKGIAAHDLKNIFDRFFMGDKSRSENANSYGLGLSIAKSIIENHGGKILCESIEDQFTEFLIKLKIKSMQ